jgi:hypothetical protein
MTQRARSTEFVTQPIECDTKIGCYMRDLDRYQIATGQTTRPPG